MSNNDKFVETLSSLIDKLNNVSRYKVTLDFVSRFPYLAGRILDAYKNKLITFRDDDVKEISDYAVKNTVKNLQIFLNLLVIHSSLEIRDRFKRILLTEDGIFGPKTADHLDRAYQAYPELKTIMPPSTLPNEVLFSKHFTDTKIFQEVFSPGSDSESDQQAKMEKFVVRNDMLEPIAYRQWTPNIGKERLTDTNRRFIVIHYTAGTSLDGAVNWLCNPVAKASAHLVIGRDGAVVQLADFTKPTWHAGASRYHAKNGLVYTGLNQYSIGIELVNPGPIDNKGRTVMNSKWDGDVEVHKVSYSDHMEWASYTPEQLNACFNVCQALFKAYPSIIEIVGHNYISPGRKIDPGPAFPLDSFKNWFTGRE